MIVVAVVGTACSNGATTSTTPVVCVGGEDASAVTSIGSTASAAGDCNLPGATWGTIAPGGACQADVDCQPTCCACPSSNKSAVAYWCNHGTCANANDTCCGFAAIEATLACE